MTTTEPPRRTRASHPTHSPRTSKGQNANSGRSIQAAPAREAAAATGGTRATLGVPPASYAASAATTGAATASETGRPTVADIFDAQKAIAPYITHTPLLTSHTFSQMSGAEVYLKAENLQRSGSFKLRGATFKLAQL